MSLDAAARCERALWRILCKANRKKWDNQGKGFIANADYMAGKVFKLLKHQQFITIGGGSTGFH